MGGVRDGPPSTGPSRFSAKPLRVAAGNNALSGFELAV